MLISLRLRFLLLTLLTLATGPSIFAQSEKPETLRAIPLITASALGGSVRFATSRPGVVQIRLEVFSVSGEKLSDSEFRPGNTIDWSPTTADDSMRFVVTVRAPALDAKSGKPEMRDSAGEFVTVPTDGTGSANRLAKWADTDTLTNAAGGEVNGLTFFGTNSANLMEPLFPNAPGIHVVEIRGSGGQTPLVLAGGSALLEIWRDLGAGTGAPAAAVTVGMARPGSPVTNDLVFSTKLAISPWVERMRITSATGNIGVGTAAPGAKLDVFGNINTSTQYNIGGQRVLSVAGVSNIFAGALAGAVNTGQENAFFGSAAGSANTTGSLNSFFGRSAGLVNTGGAQNSFFGYRAGAANTSSFNSFFGSRAGAATTSGSQNAFFGSDAGTANTTGFNNAFFGFQAGAANTTGTQNAFFGLKAGTANTGTQNAFFGSGAGIANTSGFNNSFVGESAGRSNTSGRFNTLIGQLANVGSSDLVYATAIGAGAVVSNSNSVVLGRAEETVRIPGNLVVTGTVAKGGGSFTIDHPLDPANKTLSHSFVESPDMMNVYNGNTTTDVRGFAVITLPDYFEALNRDFRYQLTVIGQFAQAIVLEEIEGNHFRIKTNKPRVKVSWQVTGVRRDAYAEAHRIPTEESKPDSERGTYLHPDVFAPKSTAATPRASEARMTPTGPAVSPR